MRPDDSSEHVFGVLNIEPDVALAAMKSLYEAVKSSDTLTEALRKLLTKNESGSVTVFQILQLPHIINAHNAVAAAVARDVIFGNKSEDEALEHHEKEMFERMAKGIHETEAAKHGGLCDGDCDSCTPEKMAAAHGIDAEALGFGEADDEAPK